MQHVVRRTRAILLAVVIGGALAACGSGGSGGASGPGGAGSPSAGSGPVTRPYGTAAQAAQGFSGWFEADATDCGEPDFVLNGRLPQAMLDSFTCRQVLTPAEIRQRCQHGPLFASAAPHAPDVRLAPDRIRITVGWSRSMDCPGGEHHSDKGTYRVVVQKYADGWSVTSYQILSGPGAGTSSATAR